MTDTRQDELELLRHQIHQGANWFYWIIGLSLVNVALVVAGADVHFIIGSSFVDAGAGTASVGLKGVHSASDAVVGSFFAGAGFLGIAVVLTVYGLLGRAAHKPVKWAFILGMLIYVADGLLYFVFEDFISGAFHIYVLYKMYQGLSAVTPFLRLGQDLVHNPPIPQVQELTTQNHADYMPPQTEPASAPVSDGEF